MDADNKNESIARDQIEAALLQNPALIKVIFTEFRQDPAGITNSEDPVSRQADAEKIRLQAEAQLKLLSEALAKELVAAYNDAVGSFQDVGQKVFLQTIEQLINGGGDFVGIAPTLVAELAGIANEAEELGSVADQSRYFLLRRQKFIILRKVFAAIRDIGRNLVDQKGTVFPNISQQTARGTATFNAILTKYEEKFKDVGLAPEDQKAENLKIIRENLLRLRNTTETAINEINTLPLNSIADYKRIINLTHPTSEPPPPPPKDSFNEVYLAASSLDHYGENINYSTLMDQAAIELQSKGLSVQKSDLEKAWDEEFDFYKKIKLQIETVQKKVFDEDPRVKALRTAKGKLAGVTITAANLYAAETAALKLAITNLEAVSMPPGLFATLKQELLNESMNIGKTLELDQWVAGLPSHATLVILPQLEALVAGIRARDLARKDADNDKQWDAIDEINALFAQAEDVVAQAVITEDQMIYVRAHYFEPATKLKDFIKSTMPKEMQGDPGVYEEQKRRLRRLSDEDLAEEARTKKLQYEIHTWTVQHPYEKALWELIDSRIMCKWSAYLDRARKENHSVEQRTKWLAIRALTTLTFWCRKHADNPDVPRSNVADWMTVENKESWFSLLGVSRPEMVFGTLGHPVMGDFLKEVLKETMVQGSLAKGLVAYRDYSDNDDRGMCRETNMPRWFICAKDNAPEDVGPFGDPTELLQFDKDFNYGAIQDDGFSKLDNTIERIAAKILANYLNPDNPHANPALRAKLLANGSEYYEMAIDIAKKIFVGFNLESELSAEAQNRFNTPMGPTSKLIGSIELVNNIYSIIHALSRYGVDKQSRKEHHNYLGIITTPASLSEQAREQYVARFQFGQPIGSKPDVGEGEEEVEIVEIIADSLDEMKQKLLAFYRLKFRTDYFERPGTTLYEEKVLGYDPVLGTIMPSAACEQTGMKGMLATLVPTQQIEDAAAYDYLPTLREDKLPANMNEPITASYGFDQYMLALRAWGQLLDTLQNPMAVKDMRELRLDKKRHGVMTTAVEGILTFIKLAPEPGHHFDMIPIIMLEFILRVTCQFEDVKERFEAIKWCINLLKIACSKAEGTEASLKVLEPYMQKLLVMGDDHNPNNTYKVWGTHGRLDPIFEHYTTTEAQLNLLEYLTLDWKHNHPHHPVPKVSQWMWTCSIPVLTKWMGEQVGMDADVEEFYHIINAGHIDVGPYERSSVTSEAKPDK